MLSLGPEEEQLEEAVGFRQLHRHQGPGTPQPGDPLEGLRPLTALLGELSVQPSRVRAPAQTLGLFPRP